MGTSKSYGRDKRLPKRKAEEVKMILRGTAIDLAELMDECGAGAVVVRALKNPQGQTILTARMHANMNGMEAPREYVSLREVVDE